MTVYLQFKNIFFEWQKQGYITKVFVWLWVSIFVFSVITSLLGIPMRYSYFSRYLNQEVYPYLQNPILLVYWRMFCDGLIAVSFFTGALWLVLKHPGRGMSLLTAYMLLSFGLIVSYYSEYYVFSDINSIVLIEHFYRSLKVLGNLLVIWFLLLFPNGRFIYRWCFYFAIGWTIVIVCFLLFPNVPLNFIYVKTFHRYIPYSFVFLLTCYSIPLFAQIYRYYKSPNNELKKKTRLVIIAMVIVLFGAFMDFGVRALYSIPGFIPRDEIGFPIPYWFHNWVTQFCRALSYSLFPLIVCFSLSKSDLWRTDTFIRRTILYSSLTLSILTIYFSLIFLFSWAFNERFSFLTSIVAAGTIALLFHPIQQAFRKRINTMFYGQRDKPYEVISELGKGMEDAIDTESTLINFCESTANVLKLPFMGIWLDDLEDNPVADYGDISSELIVIPLRYESENLGFLKVGRRSEGEAFNNSEEVLLSTIAQHISVIAHNYLLAQELQTSRELIIKGREEERKRIRRDLHDGLGPTLASTALQLQTARKLLYSKPEAGATILENLEAKMSTTLSEVRALVHDLYPSVIDQLGLEEALRREVEKFSNDNLEVVFQTDVGLDQLPAAVEIATYRIVMEALHNVHKHAKAAKCEISVYVSEYMLTVNIQDDGIGFVDIDPNSTYRGEGTGLNSMRQRSEELGGQMRVVGLEPKGVLISVSIPLLPTTT